MTFAQKRERDETYFNVFLISETPVHCTYFVDEEEDTFSDTFLAWAYYTGCEGNMPSSLYGCRDRTVLPQDCDSFWAQATAERMGCLRGDVAEGKIHERT